jgi:hypothetical protein
MLLDEWLKTAQIAFYATVGVVTVLTFLRARKGLLNTVNTEYHKKVIERLDDLSKVLLDEYDWDSPNHWANRSLVGDAVKEINEAFEEYRDAILAERRFDPPILVNPVAQRLESTVQRIRSDPFIPREIREKATELLETRAEVIEEVHMTEIKKYAKQLATGTYKGDLVDAPNVIHNRILDALNERGCGIAQIEREVHGIRLAIQKYFERFHP